MRPSLAPRTTRAATSAALAVVCAAPLAGGSLSVQSSNAKTGTYAARVGVASSCSFDVHEIVSGSISPGEYGACSTLVAEGIVETGSVGFTAGQRVTLGGGFAVLGGSLSVEIDPQLVADAWVEDDSPAAAGAYAASFFVDPSGLDLTAEDRFHHFLAFDAQGQPELRLGVKYDDGLDEIRLFLEVFEDDGGVASTENNLELVLPVGWHQVAVGWSAGAGSGSAYLCVDQPSPPIGCATLTDVDNDTGVLERVRWGSVEPPSQSDLGFLDLDDFDSTPFDDGFESGDTSAWHATSESLSPLAPPALTNQAAAQTCIVPSQRPTVQTAVSDETCSEVVLAAGTFSESVRIDRTVALAGAGSGSSVITGALRVVGTGTSVSFAALAVDTTGDRAGCYPAALEVESGASATASALLVSNAPGTPAGPCPLFADGFESGAVGAWSVTGT